MRLPAFFGMTSAVCCLVFLPGCVTTPVGRAAGGVAIVREALTASVAGLQQRAERGEAHAQYALGLVYTYGLQGAGIDPAAADAFKHAAVATRGTVPITQYIAGIDGKPGRTAIINIPKSGLSIVDARAAEGCAEALHARSVDRGALECGSAAEYDALAALWSGR